MPHLNDASSGSPFWPCNPCGVLNSSLTFDLHNTLMPEEHHEGIQHRNLLDRFDPATAIRFGLATPPKSVYL